MAKTDLVRFPCNIIGLTKTVKQSHSRHHSYTWNAAKLFSLSDFRKQLPNYEGVNGV